MTVYLLDSNIFIQAKNLYYGFDFCPAFWNWLIAKNVVGTIASIEKVGDELLEIDDELANWVRSRGKTFFLPPDDKVLFALSKVSEWTTGQSYAQSAISEFLQVADYWLIGHALAHGGIVVTNEVPSVSTRKIKIPNACIGLGISCISPYDMLRREQAKFVLGE